MNPIRCLCLLAWLWLGLAPRADAADRLSVVATLTSFADIARNIGGEDVEVISIVPARFNPHFIEPKPSDVRRVKRADLFIHAGLDLEQWRGPLLDAAGNVRVMPGGSGELDLSRGIPLVEVPQGPVTRHEGDIHLYGNPHYWLDPENGRIIAQAIADKLAAMDPAHAEGYRRRLTAFLAELDQRLPAWRQLVSAHAGQEVIAYHNEWPYLLRFAGLRAEQFLEPKPGIPPTPRQIEFLEQYVRERKVPAIVQASYVSTQAAQALAKRTGAKVVVLAQNVGELADASSYLAMIDYDVRQLAAALGGER